MKIILNIYLIFMGFTYFLIGAWAIVDPITDGIDFDIPSFMNAVGLSIIAEIGYSEVAGIYGGLNLIIGITCFLGIFKRKIAIFIVKVITFIVGSIAFGRFLFAQIPSTPTFVNTFFIFEVTAFLIGLLILFLNFLTIRKSSKNEEIDKIEDYKESSQNFSES